jgi:L-serine/L-threonine ammonia-lyase
MASAARDALGTMDRDVVADGVLHVHTPLLFSRPMSDLLGRDVYIKLDPFQPSGSFKLRGIGYTCQKALKHGARSFTSSSGGNAGLATAYAGAALGVPTTVVVPSTTPEFIRDRLAALGARVVVHGAQWSEANEEAVRRNEKDGGKLVHPFDDPDTWTGHATLVHETVADLAKATRMMTKDAVSPSDDERNTKIAAIVTCVGGGGLLAGILQGLRETGLSEHTRVVAAETLGADSMTTSLEAGKVVTLPGITSVAKSLGAAAPSSTVFTNGVRAVRPRRKVATRDAAEGDGSRRRKRVLALRRRPSRFGRARVRRGARRGVRGTKKSGNVAEGLERRTGRRGGVRRRDRRPGGARGVRETVRDRGVVSIDARRAVRAFFMDNHTTKV